MKKPIAAVIFVTIALAGCATPPATYTFNNSRSYQKSYDQVWESLVAYFATNHIQIKNIAKDSGLIYAESDNLFDARLADCGKAGLLEITTGQPTSFNVTVTNAGNAPTVHVNTKFTVSRYQIQVPDARGNLPSRNEHVVQCNSTGKLEESILNAVGL